MVEVVLLILVLVLVVALICCGGGGCGPKKSFAYVVMSNTAVLSRRVQCSPNH